jgi:hypothetical protein
VAAELVASACAAAARAISVSVVGRAMESLGRVTPVPSRPSTTKRTCGPIQKAGPVRRLTRFSVSRSGRGLGRVVGIKVLVRGVVTVSRPVGGVLYAPRGVVTIHLSGLPGDCPLCGGGRATHVPRLTLLRVGFTEPPGSPRALVRSYRTVSPSPVRASPPSAVCFLLHCPSGRPDWPLASTLPCGAPTFLDTIPVSRPVPRSPGRLTVTPSVAGRAPDPGLPSGPGHRPPGR